MEPWYGASRNIASSYFKKNSLSQEPYWQGSSFLGVLLLEMEAPAHWNGVGGCTLECVGELRP